MKYSKRAILVLVIISMFVASVDIPPKVSCASSEITKTLIFLNDVAMIDVQKYNASFKDPTYDKPDFLGGLTRAYGKIVLQSETGSINTIFQFVNGSMSICVIYIYDKAPKYTAPVPSNLHDASQSFLNRYELFTMDSNIGDMKSLVSSSDLTKSGSATSISGNLRLGVSIDSSLANLYFQNMFNGVGYSGLNLEFDNGVFHALSDDRSYIKMAEAPVNLSKEQALSIALGRAASFSYSYGGKEVSNFTIVNSQVRSELLTKGRDSVLVWYPYWKIIMPLNDYYPGSVSCIVVEIWADTSEVASVYPTGSDVGVSDTPAPSASPQPFASSAVSLTPTPASAFPVPSASVMPEPSASQDPTPAPSSFSMQPTESASPSTLLPIVNAVNFDSALLVAVVSAVVVAAVVAALAVLKRRRK